MYLALMPGPMGTLLILFIALLVFGKNLPQAMHSLGSSVNEFKKGMAEAEHAQTQQQVAPMVAAPVPVAVAPAPAPAPHVVTKQMP